jgi:hypothetical protein
MSISSIQLSLRIGQSSPSPAPAEIMSAIQSIEIMQSDTSGFQISLLAQRGAQVSADYSLLSSSLLQAGNRVILSVTVNATPQVVMDGVITHQQFTSGGNGTMMLTLTGMGISALMHLYQTSVPYPGMSDAMIAALILLKYKVLGFDYTVIPPAISSIPSITERVPQQSVSDGDYLQSLAADHGYVFFVTPGPTPGKNKAYWGPPNRSGQAQKALTIDAGPATNVESINFSYDATAPQQVFGSVSDENTEQVLPLATLGSILGSPLSGSAGSFLSSAVGALNKAAGALFSSILGPPLATATPLTINPSFVRKTLLGFQGSSVAVALMRAQSMTDQSLSSVVTVEGTLDVLRYGAILMAPGIVGVRGAGNSYDGNYYIRSISHSIRRGQYKQQFSLAREGTGSTIGKVAV